jgi:hypothetical protein
VKRRWYESQCDANTVSHLRLDIVDIWGVFFILLAGATIAIIWAGAEVYFWRWVHTGGEGGGEGACPAQC